MGEVEWDGQSFRELAVESEGTGQTQSDETEKRPKPPAQVGGVLRGSPDSSAGRKVNRSIKRPRKRRTEPWV